MTKVVVIEADGSYKGVSGEVPYSLEEYKKLKEKGGRKVYEVDEKTFSLCAGVDAKDLVFEISADGEKILFSGKTKSPELEQEQKFFLDNDEEEDEDE
jgi:hypothetical protein